MTSFITDQRTKETIYGSRYQARFPIHLPIEKIDLYKWVTEMSEADYLSYSTAHKVLGSHFEGETFYMHNVEYIGNESIIQHYKLLYHTKKHVQFYSPHSMAYVLRWFPAEVGVPWEMQVKSTSDNTSELLCLIGADFPNSFLKWGAWLNGVGGFFLKNHLKQEGAAFAKDIETKFKAA